MPNYHELIDKTIYRIFINDEDNMICFCTEKTEGGHIVYYTSADCCSDSYIYHMDNVDALIGGTIKKVEDIGEDELRQSFLARRTKESRSNGYEQEVETVHFIKFTTDKGNCTLEFRNHSNGYYDGEFEPVNLTPDVVIQCLTGKKITEDF